MRQTAVTSTYPMTDKSTSVDSIYYRDAGSMAGTRGISARARAAMYALFVRQLRALGRDGLVAGLLAGLTLFAGYAFQTVGLQYTTASCAGLGDGGELRRSYPGLSYVKIEGSRGLPFHDKAFEIGWSNAVLEHVGGREQRAIFLRELIRVSRSVFVTVPNRWFPVEHHTGIPFLHWNGAVFRTLLRGTPLRHWSEAANMDFLSRRMLLEEWPGEGSVEVFYAGLRMGPFSSNLALVAKTP